MEEKDKGGSDMGGLRQLGCKKDEGKLICRFKSDETQIQVVGGMNDKGQAVLIDSFANKEGVDPRIMSQAEQITLEKIRLKRTSEDEF